MPIRKRSLTFVSALVLVSVLAFAATASAASPVAKDGKIHACYKAKGKGKGTLRLVRNGKVRCPRKWKKVAWYAAAPGSSATVQGPQGPQGEPGPEGKQGVPGVEGNIVVKELEDKVTELLTKVKSLEAILEGVTNAELLNAIGLAPVVGALCEQTEDLNGQTTALGTTFGSLNTVLNTLLIGFSPVSVPAALPSFSCPN